MLLVFYLEKGYSFSSEVLMKVKVSQLCPTLCDPMEFSRPEYWRGLAFPSPGDLSNPGIELRSAAQQADSSPSEPPGKTNYMGEVAKELNVNHSMFIWHLKQIEKVKKAQ